jgi:hypothetical protein
MSDPSAAAAAEQWPTGMPVQVLTNFDGRWVRGFAIAGAAGPSAYRVRRVSDDAVLPAAFDPRELRPDH